MPDFWQGEVLRSNHLLDFSLFLCLPLFRADGIGRPAVKARRFVGGFRTHALNKLGWGIAESSTEHGGKVVLVFEAQGIGDVLDIVLAVQHFIAGFFHPQEIIVLHGRIARLLPEKTDQLALRQVGAAGNFIKPNGLGQVLMHHSHNVFQQILPDAGRFMFTLQLC